MPRPRILALLAALVAVSLAPSAFGHAEISPGQVEPGQEVTLTVQSIVEREALINTDMRVLVPRQWKAISCAGPITWACTLDTTSHKPHTVAVFIPVLPATPLDINFSVTVTAPDKPGVYLFRTLQTHADGWVEPWVYEKEPYVAPRVAVGTGGPVVNPDGSREDPKCFGPTKQPNGYDGHDGSGTDKGCPGAKPSRVDGVRRPALHAPTLLVGTAR